MGAAGCWGEDSYTSEVCWETVFEDHVGQNRNSRVGGDQILDRFGLLGPPVTEDRRFEELPANRAKDLWPLHHNACTSDVARL
jgi:hypothetical protein